MKCNPIPTFLFFAAALFSCNQQNDSSQSTPSDALVFPKGQKIPSNNFNGNTWLEGLVEADNINQNSVGSVTFEPGARTRWHLHPAGQIILALEGEGYYQEQGQLKRVLRKGDVVKCPPNVPHWHGASADRTFIQIAITGREREPQNGSIM
jgi:quercetin dioxygenase-like cupin family protein